MTRQAVPLMLASVALAACTSIPLTSFPKLAGVNPTTVDMMQVELAVRVQDDFQLYRDGAHLAVKLISEGAPEPQILELELVPDERPLTRYLQRQEKRGHQIVRFRVNPEDAERLETFRTTALDMKAASEATGIRGSATISARAGGCLAEGANPFQPLRMKLYLRTDQENEFFTLFRETRMSFKTDDSDVPGVAYCTDEDAPRLLEAT